MTQRLIPVLSLDRSRRLVKTVSFGERTYVGDPFNVLRLFNEKEVDEICVVDIDATVDGRSPDYGFIRELASECFMPMAYGGGITSAEQCDQIIRVGVEKVVLGAAATNPELTLKASQSIGSQAIVACVDVKFVGGQLSCVTHSASRTIDISPIEYCLQLEQAGVGEIYLQSVDRDGTRSGYEIDLVASIAKRVGVPVVALGGAYDYEDMLGVLKIGASAAASGTAFTFIGRLRAVLITYPAFNADRQR